jgi:NAD(P)-dependent dehydrogenase (short-subunit alcohol dehydrogenase family)
VNELERLFGLHGRVAVVTGASSGLGIEFAEALASAGADVALFARRRDRLDFVTTRIAAEYGVRSIGVETDVEKPPAVEAAFAKVERDFGGVDILVNNAGIAPTGRAENQWPEAWNATIRTNLTGLFHCCLAAAGIMRRKGRSGRIINVSSIFGRVGSSLFRVSAYAASKGGVETLTRQLAVEWAPDGITVNAIAPAWFESEMTAGSLEREGVRERMGSGCPMQRLGRAGELRTACLFLASPASSYVTGATIAVDGGYTAW